MLAGLLLFAATGLPEIQVDARLGLLGLVREGRSAELRVSLTANRNQQVELCIAHGSARLHVELSLEAGRPKAVALPVVVKRDSSLMLSVVTTEAGGEVQLHQQTLPLNVSAPLPRLLLQTEAFAQSATGRALAVGGVDVLVISSAELPGLAAGYGPVDALGIDAEDLGHLNPQQAEALRTHLGLCGRVIATGNPQVLRQEGVMGAAGCSGRFLLTGDALSPETAPGLLAELLARRPVSLPSASELRDTIDPEADQRLFVLLVMVVCLYPACLALNRVRWGGTAAGVLCLLITSGVLWLGRSSEVVSQQLTWLQQQQEETQARAVHLLGARARGKGVAAFASAETEPPSGGAFWREAFDQPLTLITDATRDTHVRWRAYLGEERWVFTRTVLPQRSALKMSADNGTLTLQNLSKQASEPATLAWRNTRYHVPALAPGEQWRPRQSQPWGDEPVYRLLKAKALHHPATLLFTAETRRGPVYRLVYL